VLIAPGILALALSAISHGQPAPSGADDEARIEALVSGERTEHEVLVQEAADQEQERVEAEVVAQEEAVEEAVTQFPPGSGGAVAFEDLAKMTGRSVRVRTTSGRTRVGVVQGVERNELHLRTRLRGGYAEYTLARKQIARIEAE
jgi:hypothetical protein